MKKTYLINGIDCANCAMKLENRLNKVEGISIATVNFMMSKLVIEADCSSDEEFEEIMCRVKEVTKKLEPAAVIID